MVEKKRRSGKSGASGFDTLNKTKRANAEQCRDRKQYEKMMKDFSSAIWNLKFQCRPVVRMENFQTGEPAPPDTPN